MAFVGPGRGLLRRPFRPVDIPGCVLWFEADRIGGLADGAGVAQWDDLSGLGHHLKQATGANQPLFKVNRANGKPTVLFDGSNDYLKADAFTLNRPTTVVLVFKQVTWTVLDYVYDGNTAASGALLQNSTTPGLQIHAGNNVAQIGLALDTFGVDRAAFNGASSEHQVNGGGVTVADAGAGNPGGFTLGARGDNANASNIEVYGGAVYDRHLARGEYLRLVNGYFARKCALLVAAG